ncbi:ABC transporter ATP-binding protein [Labrys wisconsinensis]|uniref:ABC-type branched-subunit amino acid transport system ATPase component n=1 Tax=Labrys wisconsinensis TaxID=425677 RepID=A0ABU0J915_9HYPH|nr:ABC transporter ATP-binding protein [Labrys wisconsinensis]MDQ0470771.1 ABC-type branched-subunit amino acid transport system ATPase component [Labrys wisconsinensis]
MLSIRDVAVSFAGVRALDGVSLEAHPGRILGLIGPNGSGKSTLLNVVAGVIAPEAGTVLLDGRPLPAGAPHAVAAQGVARTFQIPNLARRLTVAQNMLAGARRQPGEALATLLFRPGRAQRAEAAAVRAAFDMLDRLGLAHLADHPAGSLSGGQQKLLSMGMAMMADPRLILLDEPAAGVNPVLVAHQVVFLKAMAAEGRTVMLIEHNMEMVADVCDEVVVLDAGAVIARGSPAEIRRDARVMRSYLGEIG